MGGFYFYVPGICNSNHRLLRRTLVLQQIQSAIFMQIHLIKRNAFFNLLVMSKFSA